MLKLLLILAFTSVVPVPVRELQENRHIVASGVAMPDEVIVWRPVAYVWCSGFCARMPHLIRLPSRAFSMLPCTFAVLGVAAILSHMLLSCGMRWFVRRGKCACREAQAWDQSQGEFCTPSPRFCVCVVTMASVAGILLTFAGPRLDAPLRRGENFGPQSNGEIRRRMYCRNRLTMLGGVVRRYAKEHNGKLPDELRLLIPEYISESEEDVLLCPSWLKSRRWATLKGEAGPPCRRARDCCHECYIYRGKGLTLRSPRNSVIMEEVPGNHHYVDDEFPAGYHILPLRGEVKFVTVTTKTGNDQQRRQANE